MNCGTKDSNLKFYFYMVKDTESAIWERMLGIKKSGGELMFYKADNDFFEMRVTMSWWA